MNDDDRQPRPSKIPDFASKEEETAFWDTHDFTEFLDETRPVKLRVAKNLSDGVTVRLDPRDRAELNRRADALGIGPSTLIRMWIKERLGKSA
jgi:hypothetical protein